MPGPDGGTAVPHAMTSTMLFFDDWYLHRRSNLERRIGAPTLEPDGTFEDPYVDPAWGYPTVFQDPESGRWRCLYQGQADNGKFVPVMAESADGISWTVPDLSGTVHIPDRQTPHQVIPLDRFTEWSGPYVDPHARGTAEWLKGLAIHRTPGSADVESMLYTSPDGIHWRRSAMGWHSRGADPIAYPYWNSYRNKYAITARPRFHDRRVSLIETEDWKSFSAPELVLQADAQDSACAEVYGMPVIPYADMFIGLLWIYHVDPTVDALNKFVMGRVDAQLSYSYNGRQFQRTLRDPFMPNAAPGEHGSGCIYPYSVIPDGDNLRIYSSAAKGEHAQFRSMPASRQGALLLHNLRRDGFVFLEPSGGSGELHTRLLLWGDGEPSLNISAPFGEARVAITDPAGCPIDGYAFEDAIPLRGDDCAWVPRWTDRAASQLAGRVVRLAVRISNARIYAIRGPFEVMMAAEADQYLKDGVRPSSAVQS